MKKTTATSTATANGTTPTPKPTMTPELQARLAILNDEQREAVNTLEGPVLVVAGPGTGKTELLALRVATILHERDVLPQSILCLTFTDAGTQAMQSRLAELIGAAAYQVEVSTFHAFASGLASRYAQYFNRLASDTAITALQSHKLLNSLLTQLPMDDALFQRPFKGVVGSLGNVRSFISNFKRSGLKASELRAIIEQNNRAFDYLESNQELQSLIDSRIPSKAAAKETFCAALLQQVNSVVAEAPAELTERLIQTPGVYEPFISYFARLFNQTELYDHITEKASGFEKLRSQLFTKNNAKQNVLKARQTNEKLASALTICEQYQETLRREGHYDFDDMICDAITAIESHSAFKYQLQDQYQYLLVDEFQDTNGAQMRILELLCDYSTSPNILVVGDDDQAIMRFQGASVRHMLQFEQRFTDIKRIILKTNYRSLPSLVEFGQHLAKLIDDRLPASADAKLLTSFRTEVEPQSFSVSEYANRDIQYYELARNIKSRIDAGQIANASKPNEAIAVLASQHKSLQSLIPHLNTFGVPFNYKVTSAVDEIASLQTLFNCMRFAASIAEGARDRAISYLPAILAAPEFGLNAEQYIGFALSVRSARTNWLDAMRDSENPLVSSLHDWLLQMAVASKTTPMRKMVLQLAEPLQRYYQTQDDLMSIIEFNYGLRALLDFFHGEKTSSLSTQVQSPSEQVGREQYSQDLSAQSQSDAELPNTQSPPPQPSLEQPVSSNRLTDVISTLDDAIRFNYKIDVDIAMSHPEAITLATAHGSKGLQFDLVCLIDVDDNQWHRSGRSTAIVPDNLMFGQEKDEDDTKRLLFVAATRAKNELLMTTGVPGVNRELLGLVDVQKMEPSIETLVKQSDISLNERFYPDEFEWDTFVRPHLDSQQMSASLLNRFLKYGLDEGGSQEFFAENILRLPGQPALALEFGDLVHRFFQDWLNHVVKSGLEQPEQLLQRYFELIAWMDFEQAEREQMRYRLQQIFEQFLPLAGGIFVADAVAEQWGNAVLDEVPLVGKFDLLVPDQAARTVTVYDFKTSQTDGKNKPDDDQWRQLKFYKLLLENSGRYAGYSVVAAVDLFVDPTNYSAGSLSIPEPIDMSAVDMVEFSLLVKAVWQCIQSGDLDLSGFESSEQMAALLARSVYKSDGVGHRQGDPKVPSKTEIVATLEKWLVDEYLAGLLHATK